MDKRFTTFFNENADAMAADIAALVAVPSHRGPEAPGAPYGAGPREALDAACGMAESYGLSARVLGDRVCVVELGEGAPALGILAHLDVVPPAGEWTKTEPWKLLMEDGVLYGRGVADDKGPAVAALYALRAIHELGLPMKHKVQLILGSDEECGSSDVAWYLQHYKMPPRVFTPDASFPLVNGEKGHLNVTVTCPGTPEGHLVSLRGGSVSNAVPAQCEVVLRGLSRDEVAARFDPPQGVQTAIEETAEGVRITCRGKAAHASTPQAGVNAIQAMLQGLMALPLGAEPAVNALCALADAFPFGDTAGRAFGAYCEDDVSGALTVNLGVISYDGTSGLKALVDARVPVCGDGRAIANKLSSFLGAAASVAVKGVSLPHMTPASSDLVQGLLAIYEDYTGEKGEPLCIGGGTYVHNVEGGVAFGCEFPGTEYHMHEPDESTPLQHLLLSGQMFAQAIAGFCCG